MNNKHLITNSHFYFTYNIFTNIYLQDFPQLFYKYLCTKHLQTYIYRSLQMYLQRKTLFTRHTVALCVWHGCIRENLWRGKLLPPQVGCSLLRIRCALSSPVLHHLSVSLSLIVAEVRTVHLRSGVDRGSWSLCSRYVGMSEVGTVLYFDRSSRPRSCTSVPSSAMTEKWRNIRHDQQHFSLNRIWIWNLPKDMQY